LIKLFRFNSQAGSFRPSLPLIIIFLFVGGFIAYTNVIPYPFVHDDVVFIQNNPHIDQLDLKSIFVYTSSPEEISPLVNTYYRPFLEILYRIEYRLFGYNPSGYHFVNILFHVINSSLVFCLLYLLSERRKGFAFSVAVLFLLHPVQSESVACISGISNLAYALFCLCSLNLYILSKTDSRRDIATYLASLVLFILALLSKEQAVILPFLVILVEGWRKLSRKREVEGAPLRISGFLFVLAGYGILRKVILGHTVLSRFDINGELWLRVLSIPTTLLTYLKIVLLPVDLHYYRSLDILGPKLLPIFLFIIVSVAVFMLIRRYALSHESLLLFGLGWFFLTLLPVLNFVPLVIEYSHIMTSEHFLYFPLIGILIFLLESGYHLLKRLFQNRTEMFCSLIIGVLSVVFLFLTHVQNTTWRGEIPLFQRVLKYEQLARVHILLANAYYADRQYGKAIAQNGQALDVFEEYLDRTKNDEVKRVYLGFMKDVHFSLAHNYGAQGKLDQSTTQYKKAIEIDPHDPVLHNNLGFNYIRMGDLNKAITYFEKAIALDAHDVMALNNLAIARLSV